MSLVRGVFLAVFFAGGFAALLYQIIWQRILTFFGGADLESVTIVVAAFMAGLGFGNLVGGSLADRLDARARVVAFAGCELAVALFALGSTTLYYDVLYVQFGAWSLPRAMMGVVVFLVTLWPTAFMGMSLPLAARILTQDAGEPARWVPVLYGWNTLGAGCGSLFAVTVLFRTMALPTALAFGAALSLGCGLTVLLVAPRLTRRSPGPAPGASSEMAARPVPAIEAIETSAAARLSWWTWMSLYALAGFVALSLEIVWFRILGVIIKSNSSTFGWLLATYLVWTGLGALCANHPRIRVWRPASAFLLVQAMIPVCAALSLVILAAALAHVGPAEPLRRYLAQGGPYLGFSRLGIVVFGVVPFALIGPSTFMMGVSFGLLQRAVQTTVTGLGRRVGWLQGANVAGAMGGALLTGLFLIDRLGSTGTLRLLVVSGVAFLWIRRRAEASERRRPAVTRIALASGLLSVWLLPAGSTLWASLHAADPLTTIQAEDRTGVSLLKADRAGETTMFTNGRAHSSLPYGETHTVLGVLPALLHPRPATIAVIGLGSGDTVFAAASRPQTREIFAIEIVAPELTVLREFDRRLEDPALRMLLRDPRVQYRFTDGRAFLRRESDRFDIIEADALWPDSAYSGNLYSVEYFELLRDRLAPGGLAVTWVPTDRVRDTFVRVFPSVLLFEDIAIGSMTPVVFDRAAVAARMEDPFTKAYYAAGAISLEALLTRYLNAGPRVYGPEFDRSSLTDVNRDLFPKDEFGLPYMRRPAGRQ